jgi:hypothetical protein
MESGVEWIDWPAGVTGVYKALELGCAEGGGQASSTARATSILSSAAPAMDEWTDPLWIIPSRNLTFRY